MVEDSSDMVALSWRTNSSDISLYGYTCNTPLSVWPGKIEEPQHHRSLVTQASGHIIVVVQTMLE